jgi:Flp pilus assembly protein TadD
MAAQNAQKLRKRLATEQSIDVQVAELNLRGVSAFNRNDLRTADRDFRNAYALAPGNAFVLNNIGYIAEIEGDRETAQYLYDKAKTVADPKATIGLATRRSAEGLKLAAVASDSDSKVQAKVDKERDLHRSEHEPIQLRRRDNSIVDEPNARPTNSEPQSTPPSN